MAQIKYSRESSKNSPSCLYRHMAALVEESTRLAVETHHERLLRVAETAQFETHAAPLLGQVVRGTDQAFAASHA